MSVFGAGRLGMTIFRVLREAGLHPSLLSSRSPAAAPGSVDLLFDASKGAANLSYDYLARGGLLVLCRSENPDRLEELVRANPRGLRIVRAHNLSAGNLLLERTARHLAGDVPAWRAEVFERHPSGKVDAPSLSARHLASTWQLATAVAPPVTYGRFGLPVSEHRLVLTRPGETLEVRHTVTDLDVVRAGVLRIVQSAAEVPVGVTCITNLSTSDGGPLQ